MTRIHELRRGYDNGSILDIFAVFPNGELEVETLEPPNPRRATSIHQFLEVHTVHGTLQIGHGFDMVGFQPTVESVDAAKNKIGLRPQEGEQRINIIGVRGRAFLGKFSANHPPRVRVAGAGDSDGLRNLLKPKSSQRKAISVANIMISWGTWGKKGASRGDHPRSQRTSVSPPEDKSARDAATGGAVLDDAAAPPFWGAVADGAVDEAATTVAWSSSALLALAHMSPLPSPHFQV